MEHYEAVIQNYVSVDVIAQTADFSRYKVIIAPMLYMFCLGRLIKYVFSSKMEVLLSSHFIVEW